MLSYFLLLLLSSASLISCQDPQPEKSSGLPEERTLKVEDADPQESRGFPELEDPQESRGLPPEEEQEPSSYVRDVSDINYYFDEKEWPTKTQSRQERQADKAAATQMTKDRITALFGAEAKPAYGHRDPETGKVNLLSESIQDRQGFSKSEEVDRVSEDIAEPENNEINPFQLFPPGFHDLLNIPIHDYGNGSTYNPYEKFNKKPKQPLISSGYANTKLQGGKGNDGQDDSSDEYGQKPPKKVKYRTTTSRPDNYEYSSRPVKHRRPVKPKPTPEPASDGADHSGEDFYKLNARKPYTEEPKSEEAPVYVTTRSPIKPPKRPKPVDVDSFEDVRTYSRPYDEDRYPQKSKTKRPEATTYRGESYSDVQMPKYEPKRPTSAESYFDQPNPTKASGPEPAPKKPQTYDDDIIYDYDDERNTGDKAVYFHVSKPESDILKDTNSHGLPPHATKQAAIPAEEFSPVPGPRPKQSSNGPGPSVDVPFPRPAVRPGDNGPFQPDLRRPEYDPRRPDQDIRRPEQESRRPDQDPRRPEQVNPAVRTQGFPSVFNSDSPFSGGPGPSPAQRRPVPSFSEKPEQFRPFSETGSRRPPEGFRQPPVRPPQQRTPEQQLRYPPQQGYQGHPSQQGDGFFQRPPPYGQHRQDVRQPPREQSSGPLSSITNMFSSLFGRRNERRKRSVDDLLMVESEQLPTIVKLDRSELDAINTLKEQVGPNQEGTPPHFYIYPPDGSDPVLVVGPLSDKDAPHVEGAELVHVEPVVSEGNSAKVIHERQDYFDPNAPLPGLKKPPSTTSILQRKQPALLDQPVQPPKPTSTRNGVVFPKKKVNIQPDVSRKPVEAVLDPVNSELSIPENVGVVEENIPDESEESLTSQVSQAVKNTVKKLNPLQLLKNKEEKNGVVTPTGKLGNPGLGRPARPGSVPDTPFSPPLRLVTVVNPPEKPTLVPPTAPQAAPVQITTSDVALPVAQTIPPLFQTTKPPLPTEIVDEQTIEKEADITNTANENSDNELPIAEKYVRIPVKTQLSDKGVFIVEAAPLQDKLEERADNFPAPAPENALLREGGQQEQPRKTLPVPALPPLNLPSDLFKQISNLKPPQDLAQPLTLHQQIPAVNKPPLFPLADTVPGTLQERPQLQPSQPPPLLPARPAPSSSVPVTIKTANTNPAPTSVFFDPNPVVDNAKPVLGTTKFSPQFSPDSVKTFKVSSDGKPLNVIRPPQPTTTEKLHTLPPGVTPEPPRLLDLAAPFIPSQQVSYEPPQDSAVEASVSNPLWLALGKTADKREDKVNRPSDTSVNPTSPVIEIGGFVPISPKSV